MEKYMILILFRALRMILYIQYFGKESVREKDLQELIADLHNCEHDNL
jgi:hypothetical protein